MNTPTESCGSRLEVALQLLFEYGTVQGYTEPTIESEQTGFVSYPMEGTAADLEKILGADKAARLADFITDKLPAKK